MLQGDSLKFTVVCKNKHGVVVPSADAAVTVSPATLGSVTAGVDGSAGSFTADAHQVGVGALVATAGGVSSAPFPVSVEADVAIATVEIVPAV